MKGRVQKSIKEKSLNGSRHSKEATLSAPLLKKLWNMPPDLGPHGKRLWREIGPHLLKAGLLTEWDREGFTFLCSSFNLIKECEEILRRDGLTVDGVSGTTKKHPVIAVRNKAMDDFRYWAEQFCLSPVARERMGVTRARKLEKGEIDAEAFLFGKRGK